MAFLHRKALITPTKRDVVVVFCTPPDECDDLPPPAPPPVHHSLSPLIILMFCTLAVTITLIGYIAIMKTYRVCRNNRRRHENTDETPEEFIDVDQRTMIHHPIWLINTIGLDQSVIDSIEVFKYKRGDGLIEGTNCSICLGEFQNDETLRLLPKCSHAFHVPCINTWLLSHKNCPLCRAPIVKDNSNAQIDRNSIESSTREEIPNEVSEIETNQVEIAQEIDSNDDSLDKKSLLSRVQSDLAPMRRSVSMDSFSASMVYFSVSSIGLVDQERQLSSRQLVMLKKQESIKHRGSCSSINIYSRVKKSSSFGPFSSKASGSQNRSY